MGKIENYEQFKKEIKKLYPKASTGEQYNKNGLESGYIGVEISGKRNNQSFSVDYKNNIYFFNIFDDGYGLFTPLTENPQLMYNFVKAFWDMDNKQ